MKKALFLDRDGVINKEVGYLHEIQKFEFIEGIFEVCKLFQDREYLLIIITNQAGIARNYYSEEAFHRLNDWMLKKFRELDVKITHVYYSPFHPKYGVGKYRKDSWCRKPNPGMLFQAQREYNIDFSSSILVGDKESDIEAGLAAKINLNVLVRSGHRINEESTKADAVLDSIQDLPKLLFKPFDQVCLTHPLN
jgi:D-glycero-D-manno-heptose 1,7-bisphosphate phosphatase